ncbi:MAG: MerR family transcriptional regulator [Proteobacteria bacterium]|nr:MerR family transcriptional regulator [Pseudomonadota bacterium]
MAGPNYNTSELARLIGVSKNTLLRWEEEGLIPPALRDGRGWRVWSKSALEKIIELKKGKDLTVKNPEFRNRLVVNIIGYGNQGSVWAKNLRDSGAIVHILLREDSESLRQARNDGFEIISIQQGLESGGIFCVMIPDEKHETFFNQYKDFIRSTSLFIFAHGYSVAYMGLNPKARKALLAPKGIAKAVRFNYLDGKATPTAYFTESVRDVEIVKDLANKLGLAPLMNATFMEEATSDLFTEQVLLCGGVPALMVKTFNMLKENGVPEDIAVQECLQELSYILDVIKEKGIAGMYEAISPMAMAGGSKIWNDMDNGSPVSKILKNSFKDIDSKKIISFFKKHNREKTLDDIKKKTNDFDKALHRLNERR